MLHREAQFPEQSATETATNFKAVVLIRMGAIKPARAFKRIDRRGVSSPCYGASFQTTPIPLPPP